MASVEQERREREEVFTFLDGLGWQEWGLSPEGAALLLDRLLPREVPVEHVVSVEEVKVQSVIAAPHFPRNASPVVMEYITSKVE